MRPHESDKHAIHEAGSQTGMAAEHHEPKAPAVLRDEDAERRQQSANAGNAKAVCRGRPQRSAEYIALLATRGERQRGETCQAEHEGCEMSHRAPSLEATVIGVGRFALRLDGAFAACRAVRMASTA
jgi:hypothetical protein